MRHVLALLTKLALGLLVGLSIAVVTLTLTATYLLVVLSVASGVYPAGRYMLQTLKKFLE